MTNPLSARLEPGSVIGVLGGGQLGRLLAVAASRLGFLPHIYSPIADCPAAQLAPRLTIGQWDDTAQLKQFAKNCDVITYEFENIPLAVFNQFEQGRPVRPGIHALGTAQDRVSEKTFISQKAGVPVTGFRAVNHLSDLKPAIMELGLPLVLKTRRMGYDGKGQITIRTQAEAESAFEKLGAANLIAEAFIDFKREVSIIAARALSGEVAAYPLVENRHENHILHQSICPASHDDGQARKLALKIIEALDYVGVMGVEFFELKDGSYLVNEIAPRVHNSGHWSQDAGCTDQFEQHIRAIADWPLGDMQPRFKVEMTNLIGYDVLSWPSLAANPDVQIHLYGKSEIRAGRKMGHVNRILGPVQAKS